MLEDLKKTAAGAALLKEWLGSRLTPVDSSLANERAKICSTCPKNSQGNWWTSAAGLVAEAIRKQLEIKNEISAKTQFDDRLGTCECCLCNLPLKVWCPIDLIKSHTTHETLTKFPLGWCWIPKEILNEL